MDNLLQLAMQMILCLLIAAIIGAIIGYLLGKMSKCDQQEDAQHLAGSGQKELHDYTRTSVSQAAPQEGEETPAKEAMQAMPKAFEGIEGKRPEILSAPRNGHADDLKEISGIGLKIEEALNELGIFHFDQIAAWTPENAKWIDNYLVFKGRVMREDWIGQAKLLAAGGSTEFSRKVKKKDIYKK